MGDLEVRLAQTPEEIETAQRLRYDVFYEEMSAVADEATAVARRDFDIFDTVCDHLLVIDHAAGKVIATSRLLRQEVATEATGFYTAAEFQIERLIARHPDRRFLELGRACVHEAYRSKRTIELLWAGIWRYVRLHDLDVMVACGSFEGTDLSELGPVLALLADVSPAPDPWQIRAQEGLGVSLEGLTATPMSQKEALRLMPPLLKGCLRLGAYIGEDAVVDHQFGVTGVFLVLPVEVIDSRYIRFYGAEASRYAA